MILESNHACATYFSNFNDVSCLQINDIAICSTSYTAFIECHDVLCKRTWAVEIWKVNLISFIASDSHSLSHYQFCRKTHIEFARVPRSMLWFELLQKFLSSYETSSRPSWFESSGQIELPVDSDCVCVCGRKKYDDENLCIFIAFSANSPQQKRKVKSERQY